MLRIGNGVEGWEGTPERRSLSRPASGTHSGTINSGPGAASPALDR